MLSDDLIGRAWGSEAFEIAPAEAEPGQDQVLRSTGVVALIGVAVIHFAQVVPTIHQTAWLGWAFVLLSVACVAVAGQLVYRGTVWTWAQVGALNLLIIGGFAFTRLFSTAFDNQDVGNWSETLGMAALFVEGVLVLASAYAITVRRLAKPGGTLIPIDRP